MKRSCYCGKVDESFIGKEIVVSNEVAKGITTAGDSVLFIFRQFFEILVAPTIFAKHLFFLVGQEFIENETKNIVFVLVGFDL